MCTTAGTLNEMSDDSLRWISAMPTLREPTLIVMLTGWIDAAGSARAAMQAIEVDADATPVAEFDDDVYIDFRARRPVMELREGLNSVLEWERITLATGRDAMGRDIVLLAGPEPDMAWHRFTRIIGELATEIGVAQMAHLGAYPFAVPHTRPPRLSVSSPSQDVLARVPFLRSSIDVPAGAAATIERELHDRGIPSLGIWVQVPHYISSMNYPAASVSLLDGLREATGVVIEATELRGEAVGQRSRLDSLVDGNEEHARMLTQLEELYDSSDDTVPVDAQNAALEMLTGDELAEELEQFLRDQD